MTMYRGTKGKGPCSGHERQWTGARRAEAVQWALMTVDRGKKGRGRAVGMNDSGQGQEGQRPFSGH